MALLVSILSGTAALHSFQYFPFTTALIALISAAALLIKKRRRLVIAVAAGALYAAAYAALSVPSHVSSQTDFIVNKGISVISGVIVSQPVPAKGGWTQTMKAAPEGERLTVHSSRPLSAGKLYTISAVFSPARENPGQVATAKRFIKLIRVHDKSTPPNSAGIRILGARTAVNEHLAENLDRDSAALVMAVTTGERGFISRRMRDSFSRAGVAHLLSISGTHFGLFSVLLFIIIKTALSYLPGRRLERLTLHISPSEAAAAMCLPFMLYYLALSGASVPSVRSFVMISVFLAGLLIGRKRYWLNSLLIAALFLVLLEPGVMLTLSFQLSFLAVLFIGFFTIERLSKKIWLRYPLGSLALTLSAYAGVAPLVALNFHHLSVVSPIANLAVTPLVAFVLVPLSVLGSFTYLITGHYLGAPIIAKTASLAVWLTQWFASVPHASVDIAEFPPILSVLYYAGFFAFFVFNKKRLLALPLIPFVVYAAIMFISPRPPSITLLDVGQADAAVARVSDAKTVVIDTGRSGREVQRFLRQKAVRTIDALIITHADIDHSGGLMNLTDNFEVLELWDNGSLIYPEGSTEGIDIRHLRRGDTLESKGCTIKVLHPYDGFYTAGGGESSAVNDRSLVLKLICRGKSVLMLGDIEREAVEDITHLGPALKSDVLKLPHHGGRNPALGALVEASSPELAVISTGGRAHPETLELLKNTRLLRTDSSGAIKITFTPTGIKTKTFAGYKLKRAATPGDELNNIKRLFTTF